MSAQLPASFEVEHDGRATTVYYLGQGAPVLLLHELPGLTEQTLELAQRLVAQGFEVFLPLLFGKAMQKPAGTRMAAVLCVRREVRLFAQNRRSPITDRLRAVCRAVVERTGGKRMGVVGMCLTGGFVLSLVTEPAVVAPVLSQPALPFGWSSAAHSALSASPEDLATVRQRGLRVLGLRFSNDRLCQRERFATLKRELGDAFEPIVIPSPDPGHTIPADAHSVLVYNFDPSPGHPTAAALARVGSFLHEQLGDNRPS